MGTVAAETQADPGPSKARAPLPGLAGCPVPAPLPPHLCVSTQFLLGPGLTPPQMLPTSFCPSSRHPLPSSKASLFQRLLSQSFPMSPVSWEGSRLPTWMLSLPFSRVHLRMSGAKKQIHFTLGEVYQYSLVPTRLGMHV